MDTNESFQQLLSLLIKSKNNESNQLRDALESQNEEECISLLKKYPFLLNEGLTENGTNVLLYACYYNLKKLLNYLIEKQVNIHYKDKSNRNAIHWSLRSCDVTLFQTLYELGVEIDELDSSKRTPLLKACLSGRFEIIHFLIEKGANVNLKNEHNFDLYQYIKGETISFFPNSRKYRDKILDIFWDNFEILDKESQKELKKIRLKNLVERGITHE